MTDIDHPPVEPAGGAGLFDVDPAQDLVSQDAARPVPADVESLPEDLEL
jgi:hypothetical protein